MADAALHIGDDFAGLSLIPVPVQVFGDLPHLHNEIARQILWPLFTAFLAPESKQGVFVLAHDDPGVRAADEGAAVQLPTRCQRRFKSDPVCDLIAGVNLTHPLPSQLLSWRLSSLWACHDAGPPFVLQPIALAGNLHDG